MKGWSTMTTNTSEQPDNNTLAIVRRIRAEIAALETDLEPQHAAFIAEMAGADMVADIGSATKYIHRLRDEKMSLHDQLADATVENFNRQKAYGAMLAAAGVPVIEGNADQSAIAEILRLKAQVADLLVDAVRSKHNYAATIAFIAKNLEFDPMEIPEGSTLEHNAIEAACVLYSGRPHGKKDETARYLRRRGWRQLAEHEWADPQDEVGRMLMESAKNIQVTRDLAPFAYFLQQERDKPAAKTSERLKIFKGEESKPLSAAAGDKLTDAKVWTEAAKSLDSSSDEMSGVGLVAE
jgi:hypothetical protein